MLSPIRAGSAQFGTSVDPKDRSEQYLGW